MMFFDRTFSLVLIGLLVPFCAVGCVTPEQPPESHWSEFDSAGNRVPSPTTLGSLARILASRGNDVQAEVVLERLITLHPKYTPGYCEFAMLYLRQDRTDQALKVLHAGLAINPEDRALTNNIGVVHLISSDYASAVSTFEMLVAEDPGDQRAGCNLALSLGLLGRLEAAAVQYEEHLTPEATEGNLSIIAQVLHAECPPEDICGTGPGAPHPQTTH